MSKIRNLDVPDCNPLEKHILYRIRRLLRFNVRLIFVFDGPRRPHKRGRPAGRIQWEDIKLLKDMLHVLRIPTHRAPAEAEAECAALQRAGKVDVVWSEDGDSLMFGCTSLITTFRIPKTNGTTEKHGELVRLFTAQAVQDKHGIDQQGLVLFAMLCGGDYDTTGVRGCGPKTAIQVAKMHIGLASTLCNSSQHELPLWRENLVQQLRQQRSTISVPMDFPNYKTLEKYSHPVVTTVAELRSKRFHWELPVDEFALRRMMHDRFNYWTKGYLESFAPWFLVKALASTPKGQESENDRYDIRLKKRRIKKEAANPVVAAAEQVLIEVTFKPAELTKLNLTIQPVDEDWLLTTKTGITYGPQARVECEVPVSVLRKGLGPDFATKIEPVESNSKKRKSHVLDSGSAPQTTPKTKRQRKTKLPPELCPNKSSSAVSRVQDKERQRGRPKTSTSSKAASGSPNTSPVTNTVAESALIVAPPFKKPPQLETEPTIATDKHTKSQVVASARQVVSTHTTSLAPSASARRLLFLGALEKRTLTGAQAEAVLPQSIAKQALIIDLDTDDDDIGDDLLKQPPALPITSRCETTTQKFGATRISATGKHKTSIEILDLTGS